MDPHQEIKRLREVIEQKDIALRESLIVLRLARTYVEQQNQSEGLMEGFGPRAERPSDVDLMQIDATDIKLRLLLSEHDGKSRAVSISSEDSPAASPRPEQTCIECGRGIGQLHKPKCSHTGRFLGEKDVDVSADTARPTEGLY